MNHVSSSKNSIHSKTDNANIKSIYDQQKKFSADFKPDLVKPQLPLRLNRNNKSYDASPIILTQHPEAAKENTGANLALTKQEAQMIRDAFSKKNYDPTGSDAYVSEMRKIAYAVLPDRILDVLCKLRSSDSGKPFIVIDGLPINNDVTGSPNKGELGSQFKENDLTENLLVGITSVIGEPYSIKHEGSEIVNNLVPSKAAAGEYTGLGFDVELDFHIENAMQARVAEGDTSPTELVLLGVRGEPNGDGPKTKVADCRQAIALLAPQHVETLRKSVFALKPPYRWRKSMDAIEQDETAIVSPIITGPDHAPRVTVAFYPNMVAGLSEDATEALDALKKALEQVSVGVLIHPGRLVVVNNRFCLHSREKFNATFDSRGRAHRWLQRVFVRPDLWNFREFNRYHDRVFAPIIDGK